MQVDISPDCGTYSIHSVANATQMLKYLSIRSVKAYREIIEATKALLLFGTPHQGQIASPEVYKIDEPVSGSSLFQVLRDLAKGSDYMRTYRETVTNLSATYPHIQFFTMYETDCAPTYMKDVSSRISPDSEIRQVLTLPADNWRVDPRWRRGHGRPEGIGDALVAARATYGDPGPSPRHDQVRDGRAANSILSTSYGKD